MKKYAPLFVVPTWMLLSIIAAILIMSSATAAEAEPAQSIYCEDGSLCVPEGEPEPECD